MESLEAVVLAGGASRRMGQDKSRLLVADEPILERLVRLLAVAGSPVTVLGGRSVAGAAFVPDDEAFSGPLSALADWTPSKPLVMVVSCDAVRFHAGVVQGLLELIGPHEAAIPVVEGRPQPLCALYRASAFDHARATKAEGSARIRDWTDRLDALLVDEDALRAVGIAPREVVGVNDPDSFRKALEDGVQIRNG
ncbi:MAG: molybdenum cofactor guanylyltransferase [Nitrospirae bacterium]|nr:molybdenum cofactor guanylyltransferase [Fimbriimonadaceae bacterium]